MSRLKTAWQDRLWSASPLDEFELGNPNIRLQIEIAARISRTERHRSTRSSVRGMRQAHEDAERMDRDVICPASRFMPAAA